MKAIVQSRYGNPEEVLSLADIERPVPRNDEVLIRVRAASMHADVWHVIQGWPYLLRVMGAGLLRPKVKVPGTDVAGTIEAAGQAVTGFSPGDEVCGEIIRGHQWKNGGAFAEYVAAPIHKLAAKPTNLPFDLAAAVPTSGLLALQMVDNEGHVEAGQRVLVNGAGGAVGTFVVQIAKARGAHVTAVDSGEKLEMLESLGADAVIDYTAEDFTEGSIRYDVIIDVPMNHPFDALARALAADGRYVVVGHDGYGTGGNRWFGGTIGKILKLQLTAPFGRRKGDQGERKRSADPLVELMQLVEAGHVVPVVDRTFPLADVAAAVRYQSSEVACGKIVITI